MTDSHPDTAPEALLRQAGFLRALAQGLLGDEHASEDVVQSAWLAALEREPGPLRTPRAWLARVTRNLAIKRRRGEVRRSARERAVARPEALAPSSEAAESEDTLRSVTEAVLALDEPYRSTILLRYFEGLELAEIAARRREPLATVRSRHTRALAQLRERLDRAHGGDRSAWALGLVALVGGERLGLVGAGVGTATSVTAGALIVTTKLKLAALTLAFVGLTALWLARDSLMGGGPAQASAASPSVALVTPGAAGPDAALAEVEVPGDRARSVAEPTAPAPVATRGSLRVSVAWHDGTPAAGVVVKAYPRGATDPFLESYYARVDERGEVLLDGLAPGSVGVYVDRGGHASADVRAGEEARAAITMREGLEVSGRVLDLEGLPVPGAEIWLSDTGNGTQGTPVALSDGRGRFLLRDVSDQNNVGARKAGYAPSPSFGIEGSRGDTRELELILQGRGAALALRVVDAEGEAIEGARVRVTEEGFRREGYDGEVWTQRPIAHLLVTDEEGACAAGGLEPGAAEVVVSTSGLAPWTGTVELVAGATLPLEVVLTDGVTLRGIVRATDGEPLAGATVRVGEYADLRTRETRSATDGSYELVGLAPGELAVTASLRDAGRDSATLSAAEGDVLAWDAVIDPGRVLRGRLVDERGDGLAGWRVDVLAGGRGWDRPPSFWGQTDSDEEGRFRVVNCPDEPLFLSAIESARRVVFPEVSLEGLRADGEEHLIEIADVLRASAWIEGRLLGPDGRPFSAQLTLERADRERGHVLWSDVDTGAFRIGPLAPQTYALSALGQADESLRREGLALAAGQTLDLGTLRLGGPGLAEIVVAEVEGIDPERVYLSLMTPDRVHVRTLTAAQTSAPLELPGGRYLLEAWGRTMVREQIELVIAPEETTRVELTPRLGVRLGLRFQLPDDVALPLELELVLHPDDGGEPWETGAYLPYEQGVPREHLTEAHPLVPPSAGYLLEVSGPDGLRGSAAVTAERLQPDAYRSLPPLEVVLR